MQFFENHKVIDYIIGLVDFILCNSMNIIWFNDYLVQFCEYHRDLFSDFIWCDSVNIIGFW